MYFPLGFTFATARIIPRCKTAGTLLSRIPSTPSSASASTNRATMCSISAASNCVGCEGLTDTLTESELTSHLALIPDWKTNSTNTAIYLDFRVRNFKTALDYMNKVGELAEAEGHHPDISIYSYNHVRVELSTHSLGGLTTNDIILAAKIDTVPIQKRPLRKKSNKLPEETTQ